MVVHELCIYIGIWTLKKLQALIDRHDCYISPEYKRAKFLILFQDENCECTKVLIRRAPISTCLNNAGQRTSMPFTFMALYDGVLFYHSTE